MIPTKSYTKYLQESTPRLCSCSCDKLHENELLSSPNVAIDPKVKCPTSRQSSPPLTLITWIGAKCLILTMFSRKANGIIRGRSPVENDFACKKITCLLDWEQSLSSPKFCSAWDGFCTSLSPIPPPRGGGGGGEELKKN